MRKIILISMIILFSNATVTAYTEESELKQIASIVMDNKLEITSWEVTMKEKATTYKLADALETLKDNYAYDVEEDTGIIKYTFKNNSEKDMNINYEIIIPKNNKEQGQMIVTIKGIGFSENMLLNYENVIKTIKNIYFTPFLKVYTCLITTNNDIIGSVDFINKLKRQLDVKDISSQTDTVDQSSHEKIFYGYTPLWQEGIQVDEKLINIQIAIKRTENNQFKVLIGTPILINEY